MRASARRGSRITSRRVYVRDDKGRFARTPGSSGAPTAKATTATDERPWRERHPRAVTTAKVAGTAALVIAATAAGTAIAASAYHQDTAALAAAYRSALAAEQMDYRVHRLLEKHRTMQRNTTTRRTR